MKKVLFSTLMVLSLLFASTIVNVPTFAFADENETNDGVFSDVTADYELTSVKTAESENATKSEKKEINQIFDEYGLEPLDTDLPSDTKVLNFNSVDEFEKFMEETEETAEIETIEESEEPETFAQAYLGMETAAAASSTKTYTTHKQTGFARVKLSAKVHRNSKGKVTSTNVWTSFTGVTFSLDWSQNYAYANLNSKKTGGKAYGGGTLKYVIFVEGIGTVASRDVSLSLKF